MMFSDKALVIGDIHIGVNKNNHKFFDTVLSYADWLISILEKNKIDTIIQLGDVFHNREMIHNPALNCANSFFEKLKNYNIHIVTGNHDSLYNNTSEINSLKLLSNWPNITVHENISVIDGICFCGWGTTLEQIPDDNKIIFGHFDIKGFHMSAFKVSEHGFVASELMEKCQLLMTGHYHKPQTRVYNKKPLIYAGSAFQLDWGESGDDKFVYILDTKNLHVTSIKNDCSPRFEYIRSEKDYSKIPNNFVKVELERSEDFNDMVTKMKSMNALDVFTQSKPLQKSKETAESVKEFKGISVFDTIDEYVSLLEISVEDKEYVSKKNKELYSKCDSLKVEK